MEWFLKIAELMDLGINVNSRLTKLSKQKKEAIIHKIEEDLQPPNKKRRSTKQFRESIFNFVKKKCYCVGFNR